MKLRIGFVWIALSATAFLPRPAGAAFHLMEIQQVIGGIGGDTTAQAVQLGQRSPNQTVLNNFVRLMVRDAAGNNAVTLSLFPLPNPTDGTLCRPILLGTASFAAKTTPAATLNYTMTPIPPTYIPGGTITFEQISDGGILWRLSWGTYSGSNLTNATNGDGDNSPPFAAALPSTSAAALKFSPACGTASTSNAAQYAVTPGPAVFTNNANASFTVVAPPPVPGLPGASKVLLPMALGLAALALAVLRRQTA